jgi:hypothetical protein
MDEQAEQASGLRYSKSTGTIQALKDRYILFQLDTARFK